MSQIPLDLELGLSGQAEPMSICRLLPTQIHRIIMRIIILVGLVYYLQGTGWIRDGLIWGRVGHILERAGQGTGWLAPDIDTDSIVLELIVHETTYSNHVILMWDISSLIPCAQYRQICIN